MGPLRYVVVILFAVSGFTACVDQPTSMSDETSVLADLLSAEDPSGLGDGLAFALAQAMSERAFQVQVLEVLKASDFVEHKVEVSDFLTTSAGAHFLAQTAASINADPDRLMEKLADLPALDFYVPIREHRLTWLPGRPMAVGFAPSPDDNVVEAYLPSGESVRLQAQSIRSTPFSLFLLHPAEPKARRYGYDAPREGHHIQEAQEFDVGGVMNVTDRHGETRRVEFADLPHTRPIVQIRRSSEAAWRGIAPFAEETRDGPRAGIFVEDVTPGTMLNWDQPFEDDGFGACEIYSRQNFFSSTGVLLEGTTRWPVSGHVGGLPCDPFGTYIWDWMTDNEFGIKVFSTGMSTGSEYVGRRMIEVDAFNDDDWGVGQYRVPSPGEDPVSCFYDDPLTSAWGHSGYCAGTYAGLWGGAIWSYAF